MLKTRTWLRSTASPSSIQQWSTCPTDFIEASTFVGRFLISSHSKSADSRYNSPNTALSNLEDRAHSHVFNATVPLAMQKLAVAEGGSGIQNANYSTDNAFGTTSDATSGLPYIQLLTCMAVSDKQKISLPSGALLFNAQQCPPEWVVADRWKGRLLVGLPSGGVAGASWGGSAIAFGAVAAHTHHITNMMVSVPKLESCGICGGNGGPLTRQGTYNASGVTDMDDAGLPYSMLPLCEHATPTSTPTKSNSKMLSHSAWPATVSDTLSHTTTHTLSVTALATNSDSASPTMTTTPTVSRPRSRTAGKTLTVFVAPPRSATTSDSVRGMSRTASLPDTDSAPLTFTGVAPASSRSTPRTPTLSLALVQSTTNSRSIPRTLTHSLALVHSTPSSRTTSSRSATRTLSHSSFTHSLYFSRTDTHGTSMTIRPLVTWRSQQTHNSQSPIWNVHVVSKLGEPLVVAAADNLLITDARQQEPREQSLPNGHPVPQWESSTLSLCTAHTDAVPHVIPSDC